MELLSPEWLAERQRQYDLRAAKEQWPADRTSIHTMAAHRAIVTEVDALPISHGGRKSDRAMG